MAQGLQQHNVLAGSFCYAAISDLRRRSSVVRTDGFQRTSIGPRSTSTIDMAVIWNRFDSHSLPYLEFWVNWVLSLVL